MVRVRGRGPSRRQRRGLAAHPPRAGYAATGLGRAGTGWRPDAGAGAMPGKGLGLCGPRGPWGCPREARGVRVGLGVPSGTVAAPSAGCVRGGGLRGRGGRPWKLEELAEACTRGGKRLRAGLGVSAGRFGSPLGGSGCRRGARAARAAAPLALPPGVAGDRDPSPALEAAARWVLRSGRCGGAGGAQRTGACGTGRGGPLRMEPGRGRPGRECGGVGARGTPQRYADSPRPGPRGNGLCPPRLPTPPMTPGCAPEAPALRPGPGPSLQHAADTEDALGAALGGAGLTPEGTLLLACSRRYGVGGALL